MIMSKDDTEINQDLKTEDSTLTASQKRRIRRKRLQASRAVPESESDEKIDIIYIDFTKPEVAKLTLKDNQDNGDVLKDDPILDFIKLNTEMSSKQVSQMRDDVIAAREAKKLAKQKVKKNLPETNAVMDTVLKVEIVKKDSPVKTEPQNESLKKERPTETQPKPLDPVQKVEELKKEVKPEAKSKDEVDRAIVKNDVGVLESEKAKEKIKAEREAKKAAKQAKKKGAAGGDQPVAACSVNKDITVKDVVDTLTDIVNVAKEVQEVSAKVKAIDLETKKPEETKSKAELKAERRAKQEAQRAAKQAAQEKATPKAKTEPSAKPEESVQITQEKSPKQKPVEKSKKPQSVHRANWFQHLNNEHDKESLKKIPINSNLHPAIVKLGVQLASRVVTGSNARCIALLDALKKMVRDYTLPARTEFGRGLEAHLATSVEYLWAMRRPSASQTNALNYFRHQLTQLPNNVDEFDAKKTLQEEIDTYIREQIDKAGEAISIAVRNKISNGDNILTYGCSSLIERILREAWEAGVQFRAVVVGQRVNPAAKEMLRRLVASHVPCTYMDITALNFAMNNISKVVLGASSVLVDGSVVCGAGGAQTALAARARNLPVLVACETHKFADNVHTDAFVYNEIGDPDDLIDQSDENSPLKDWRSNPNLTPLNLTYDITPPSLVTAVVTELAILPCTSAPVVLRFKLSEYGV